MLIINIEKLNFSIGNIVSQTTAKWKDRVDRFSKGKATNFDDSELVSSSRNRKRALSAGTGVAFENKPESLSNFAASVEYRAFVNAPLFFFLDRVR